MIESYIRFPSRLVAKTATACADSWRPEGFAPVPRSQACPCAPAPTIGCTDNITQGASKTLPTFCLPKERRSATLVEGMHGFSARARVELISTLENKFPCTQLPGSSSQFSFNLITRLASWKLARCKKELSFQSNQCASRCGACASWVEQCCLLNPDSSHRCIISAPTDAMWKMAVGQEGAWPTCGSGGQRRVQQR